MHDTSKLTVYTPPSSACQSLSARTQSTLVCARDLLALLWTRRALLAQIFRHDLESRHRGMWLGMMWVVITPLLMLGIYSFVFGTVFHNRWPTPDNAAVPTAMLIYSGLILFGIFSETVARAPTLIREHGIFVKKIAFPLEILPVTTLMIALFNSVVSFALFGVLYLVMVGLPPVTAFLLPVILLPLIVLTLGLSYFIAALGVYLRDLQQVVGIAVSMLLFLCPIFFPLASVPAAWQPLIMLNPLTAVIEQSKNILFWGVAPDWAQIGISVLVSLVIALIGYAFFNRVRSGFADAL